MKKKSSSTITPIDVPYDKIVNDDLSEGAILNHEFQGFLEDYLVIHCLMRTHKPKNILEIGTNQGTGTFIIANALGEASKVYSLDLPPELHHLSKQHVISEGKTSPIGSRCPLPYEQLTGDSLEYDYKHLRPLDACFIDGEHDYEHVLHETKEMIKAGCWLMIYHDADIEGVYKGIIDGMKSDRSKKKHSLYRVSGTRIMYAIKEA